MTRTIHLFVFALLAASVAAAQAPPPTAPPASTPAAAAPSATPDAPAVPAVAVEAGEPLVKPAGSTPAGTGVAAGGQGYTYNAERRRDPFLPLLKNSGKSTNTTTAAGRVAGLAGLGVADVSLRGVLMSQGGYVGMLQGTDDKTYIVRTGDKLADGTIRAITGQMMLIHQEIKDPLSRQKEREVRKMLRQMDRTN
jgi:hypothetical protein